MTTYRVRWGDNDFYLGPLTFARPERGWRPWALVLRSGNDEDRGCTLRVSLRGYTAILALPPIVRPHREKQPANWDAETVQRLGRDYWWDVTPREFGFSVADGHLSLYYGRQTNDSSTEQRYGWFLPWTQWRHVRRSFYDLQGKHFWSESEAETLGASRLGGKAPTERWEIVRSWEAMCPKATFHFQDFDGEALSAATKIEEREWRFGTGWFKWLTLFRPAKIRRSLDIEFSGETGRRKGSWKGGTIGHSIDMKPGELHEGAFRRYCDENKMTFKGPAP